MFVLYLLRQPAFWFVDLLLFMGLVVLPVSTLFDRKRGQR